MALSLVEKRHVGIIILVIQLGPCDQVDRGTQCPFNKALHQARHSRHPNRQKEGHCDESPGSPGHFGGGRIDSGRRRCEALPILPRVRVEENEEIQRDQASDKCSMFKNLELSVSGGTSLVLQNKI